MSVFVSVQSQVVTMPTAQVIGTEPLKDQEEPKVNDGDFELIRKIRCFAGLGYVSCI